jgi:hypothetical protein
MVCPGCRDSLYSWVGANYSAYWERTPEEGIKKCLGAFRPDFPVAAGQQVSLICMQGRSVQLAGSQQLLLLHGNGPRRRESRRGWMLSDLTSL